MNSIEINGPFKISIDVLKSILAEDISGSVVSELKKCVFNKKDTIEILNKLMFKDKYDWKIPTKVIDRYITVKTKNILLLESQLKNINKKKFIYY